MTTFDREETLRRLEASGLRGRGGAAFPAHRKWRAVLAEDGVPFVVANGGEGEPGSVKDRFVLRTRPDRVVDGLSLAMDTVGAEKGYVYLKGSFAPEEARVRAVLAARGLEDRIAVHRGDDTYVGGEETALLESLEGRKAWPRPKPPRPAAVGLFGRPTLVQNVDTLARVPEAVKAGADFPAIDSVIVTVWGDVRTPGAFEVPAGATFRSVIEKQGGGATCALGLVFPNGAHSRSLSEAELDLPIDALTCASAGFRLGTASILVLDPATSPASITESVARFFEREACGQCPPCTLGTENLRRLVTGDRPPTLRLTPQNSIRETVGFMEIHGYCGHARAGAHAVSGLFARWEKELLDGFRGQGDGTRPARDPFRPGSDERAALEAFLDRL